MQISQLFMFQAPHTWFTVAQVMSFGEWLSIIARSELGSDLDCSVINARSELGSDLDCYELTLCQIWDAWNPQLLLFCGLFDQRIAKLSEAKTFRI